MQEMRDKKVYKIYRKQQNDRSKSLLISNYFKYKQLNLPIKRQKLVEGFKKKTTMTQLYAMYKRLILDPNTQTD